MKHFLAFSMLLCLLCSSIAANAEATVGFYMGSQPLGPQIKTSDALDGPTGSLLVPTPGVGQKGNKSISSGFSFIKQENIRIYQIPVSFSYTLIDNLDLSVALPVLKITGMERKNWGLSDINSTVKYGIELDVIKTAVSMGIAFPTGAERFTGKNNKLDLSFDFPIEKEFETFVLNTDLGIAYTDIHGDKNNIVKIAGAVSRSFTKNFGGSIDMLYQNCKSYSSFISGLGMKYNACGNSFNCVIARDLHKKGVDFLFSLGFSRNF